MKNALQLSLVLGGLFSADSAEPRKVKRRFTAEPEWKKEATEKIDRDQKLLPPKFVADKYGVKEGDELNHTVALKIDEEARGLGEKPPNFFKVKDDEVLLLPEVFSQLDPDKVKRGFALPGDAKDEQELRNSRWWGRIYLDGWPQTVQYFRAHFGEPPPEGVRRVVLADPPDACGPLEGQDYPGAIVFAKRGTCTFSSKARAAAKAGADALVLVNNEEGNDHLAGPDAHDVGVSVSMVAKADGDLVLKVLEERLQRTKEVAVAATLERAGERASERAGEKGAAALGALTGALVPIHCAEKSDERGDLTAELGSDLCAPCTAAERQAGREPLEGGWLTLSSDPPEVLQASADLQKAEFMIATFGVAVDPKVAVEVAVADKQEGCAPLEGGGGLTFEEFNERHLNETSEGVEKRELVGSRYEGKAVLLKRGGCSFIDKAKAAQATGAAMLIVANSHLGLSRFGVEPRWKGLGINIPCVMVTEAGGAALLEVALAAAASQGGASAAYVTATLSKGVSGAAWDEVELFRTGAAFGNKGPKAPSKNPAVAKAAAALLAKHREAHAGWPERLAALQEGFDALGLGDAKAAGKSEL